MRITSELKRNNQIPSPTMTSRRLLDIDRITYATDGGPSGKNVTKTLFLMLGKGFKHVAQKGFEFVRNAVKNTLAKLNNDDLQLFQ